MEKFWKFFILLKERRLNPGGIYKYRVIKKNMNRGYLGTGYILYQFCNNFL